MWTWKMFNETDAHLILIFHWNETNEWFYLTVHSNLMVPFKSISFYSIFPSKKLLKYCRNMFALPWHRVLRFYGCMVSKIEWKKVDAQSLITLMVVKPLLQSRVGILCFVRMFVAIILLGQSYLYYKSSQFQIEIVETNVHQHIHNHRASRCELQLGSI